jgi:bis(5'-nucleosyl)-tetraphosphatase (symmetrical)
MSTYAIGDVQGCFEPLTKLLEKIAFDPKQDTLWFTGDLINRGAQSLETLRFIKALGDRAITVLGNHDLGMLTVARGAEPFETNAHTFGDILAAEDKEDLLYWLEQQPLLHYDAKLGCLLVHAGLYPWWDLDLALKLAKEVESVLQSEEKYNFYKHHYGNTPERWSENLKSFDRLRFIVNAFTRMRFCSPDGKLDLTTKESASNPPKDYFPWFELLNQKPNNKLKIIFGHWAALRGECPVPNLFALDTGCGWGDCLTALRLEDGVRFNVSCE